MARIRSVWPESRLHSPGSLLQWSSARQKLQTRGGLAREMTDPQVPESSQAEAASYPRGPPSPISLALLQPC